MAAELAVGVIVIGSILLMWMNGLEMNKDHVGIKLLFNLISMWMLVLGANIALELAIGDSLSADVQSNLETFYVVLMFVVIFYTGYWIIMYVKDVLQGMSWFNKEKKKKEEEEE